MAAAAESRPRSKPGWMSIPGGPREPNRSEFRAKMQAAVAAKTKLIEQLKDIQSRSGARDDKDREANDRERGELRNRLNDIDGLRKRERDARHAKNEEIGRIRKQRSEIESKLNELSNELGSFRDLADIEKAIDHIMVKMETGGGSLASEKRTIKRLHQLEEAKNLILQLQPLAEAIADAEDQEAELQQEYREIHERIAQLNKEYEEHFSTKVERDKEAKKHGVDRSALVKERDDVRSKLSKINEEMGKLRETFNKQQEAWDAWREEARAKYTAKIQAERQERERRYKERQDAEKTARRKARALKRQNPHEAEINGCSTLVRYLKDRLQMSKRDEEERQRRAAAATFDPTASAPPGCVFVANDNVHAALKGVKKPPKKDNASTKERLIQHSEEKARLFGLVGVDAPMNMGGIEATIAQLEAKQREFESHIKSGDIVLTSSEEEEDGEDVQQPKQDAPANPSGEAVAEL